MNYPIKQILVAMEGSDDIDMSNDIVQFCVSWTSINTIAIALRRLCWLGTTTTFLAILEFQIY